MEHSTHEAKKRGIIFSLIVLNDFFSFMAVIHLFISVILTLCSF